MYLQVTNDEDPLLEVEDDEVVVTDQVDCTHLSQQWLIYPDSQKEKKYTIVSSKLQKVLQCDDQAKCGFRLGDVQEQSHQWTMDNGCFVVMKEGKAIGKQIIAFPMVSFNITLH